MHALPYRIRLAQANERGRYLDCGTRYTITIEATQLTLNRQAIPLTHLQAIEPVGPGLRLIYLDHLGVSTQVMLTTFGFLGIYPGRSQKLNGFVATLSDAWHRAWTRTAAPAPEPAPRDTCHRCGARGGQPLAFASNWGVFILAGHSGTTGVFCRRHATLLGLGHQLRAGLLGWWSLTGPLYTPVCIWVNTRALLAHSHLPRVLTWALAILAWVPFGFLAWYLVGVFGGGDR